MTLYGQAALQGWISLEIDPGVETLCERPLVIPDSRPLRVVDFWASGPNRNELILMSRPKVLASKAQRPHEGAFSTWAAEVGCTIREVVIDEMTPKRRRWVEDWTEVLQTISAYKPLVTESLTTTISLLLNSRRTLGELVRAVDVDGEVARAAAYLLVYRGTHRFVGLEADGLDDDTPLEVI